MLKNRHALLLKNRHALRVAADAQSRRDRACAANPATSTLAWQPSFSLFSIFRDAIQDTQLFQFLIGDGLGFSFECFEALRDFVHKKGGAYLVRVLILGHPAAVLHRHWLLKDRTLLKCCRQSDRHYAPRAGRAVERLF